MSVRRELLQMLRKLLNQELRKAKRRRGKSASVMLVVGLGLAVFLLDYFLREPDAPLPKPGTDLVCAVREVYDGDTATVACPQGKLKIRVWGIDAPEMGQQPWGEASKAQLQDFLSGTDTAQVQVQVVDTDRYGRAVARLFVGAQDAGLAMVRQGRAVVYQQYNDSPAYRAAEAEARRAGLGVWSEPGAQQDPSVWRKVNPNPR